MLFLYQMAIIVGVEAPSYGAAKGIVEDIAAGLGDSEQVSCHAVTSYEYHGEERIVRLHAPEDAKAVVDPDLYIESVDTQGGGYRHCVICGADDYDTGTVKHAPHCTPEFRASVARTVGYS